MSIGELAFYCCDGLTNMMIPASVTSIGDRAFAGCSSIESFSVAVENPSYKSVSGLLLTKDGEMLIAGVNGYVVIPDGVTSIGPYAFAWCNGLMSIRIPSSMRIIGDTAFAGCIALTSVTMPDGVWSIGKSVFSGCSGLTSVTIPISVTSISDYVFSGCSGLTRVTIHDSVTNIGDGVFSRCNGLTNVTIPDSVTNIGSYAFSGCNGLMSVRMSDSMRSIGGGAFDGCSGLVSVTIPDCVTYIGWKAFSGCSGLKVLYVPAGWDATTELRNADVSSSCVIVPYDATGEAKITEAPVAVPEAWLVKKAWRILSETDGCCDYEAAAVAAAANGRPVWECYLTGVDPEVLNQLFEAILEYDENGKLTVKWTPDLNEDEAKNERLYWVQGKKNMMDEEWTDVKDLEVEGWRFFRVGVKMP